MNARFRVVLVLLIVTLAGCAAGIQKKEDFPWAKEGPIASIAWHEEKDAEPFMADGICHVFVKDGKENMSKLGKQVYTCLMGKVPAGSGAMSQVAAIQVKWNITPEEKMPDRVRDTTPISFFPDVGPTRRFPRANAGLIDDMLFTNGFVFWEGTLLHIVAPNPEDLDPRLDEAGRWVATQEWRATLGHEFRHGKKGNFHHAADGSHWW